MLRPDAIIRDLRTSGELWESTAGLVGVRGFLAKLFKSVSAALADLSLRETEDEWRMPSAISFETLERARYFESFPHWLTAASHLRDDNDTLERIAHADHSGEEARRSLAPADAALTPAVCYHTYAALAGKVVRPHLTMTAEETCWRHEGDRLSPLARGWAFRMREIVFLGESTTAEEFRQRTLASAMTFAESIGITVHVAIASDPFFAPTSRGKALLQRVKALKHELIAESPGAEPIAIASFNNHERFFGEAFDIRLPSGQPVTTACAAFGLERWVLAVLMAHGSDPANWPELETNAGVIP